MNILFTCFAFLSSSSISSRLTFVISARVWCPMWRLWEENSVGAIVVMYELLLYVKLFCMWNIVMCGIYCWCMWMFSSWVTRQIVTLKQLTSFIMCNLLAVTHWTLLLTEYLLYVFVGVLYVWFIIFERRSILLRCMIFFFIEAFKYLLMWVKVFYFC